MNAHELRHATDHHDDGGRRRADVQQRVRARRKPSAPPYSRLIANGMKSTSTGVSPAACTARAAVRTGALTAATS
jgi:hypothetical protein